MHNLLDSRANQNANDYASCRRIKARKVWRLECALHLEGCVLADTEGMRGVAGDGLFAVHVLGALHHR